MLNEEYIWEDVRYQISGRKATHSNGEHRRISYDAMPSFIKPPDKALVPVGTILYRLGPPISFSIFTNVWWTSEKVFERLRAGAATSSELRQKWQNLLAMRKPNKGKEGELGGWTGEATTRTHIARIVTIQPVYAWVGVASNLFRKDGGEEQIYLPNLGRGYSGNRSDYARLDETYTLSTI